ncbi:alpha/beta fold hydrolase [Paenibacillus contaminans]|uniref:Alpha/beta hydrolase n=1 Tax=Paenibacillus contaminans TaxID=450362 RepID=A0A329M9K8_9BACL|nr:alpha/beta hydrolase [Paenibacillus contaminans]
MSTVWEVKMISTFRGIFEVFVTGEGDPIGVTHYYSAFTKRGYYFADRFAGLGKVILINLKECGNSDRIVDECELDMNETIEDLEAIRAALGYQKWSFAGHSTGGMLGLIYAIRHGGSLNKLIAAGAAASNRYMESKHSMYCRDNPQNTRLREIFSILQSDDTSNELKGKAAREWTEMSLHHPERWDEYFSKPSSGRTVQKRLDYYNKSLSSFDIRDSLPFIETPTLVLCGKYDAQCPLASSEEIHRLIPGSTLHVFEDSNHCPHLEEPETFIETIKAFFMLK